MDKVKKPSNFQEIMVGLQVDVEIFVFFTASRLDHGPIRPPDQYVGSGKAKSDGARM
jgi:hypothetical protein